MTTTEYLLNAAFVLLVFRQARERRLDRRSFVLPLVAVLVVGETYLRSIPTAGNDLVFIVSLTLCGVALGLVSGLATHVRAGIDGTAIARVGWIAGFLLVLGIGGRMAFSFAVSHGLRPDVREFSIAHHIGGTAWPVALVLMAISEVVVRVVTVALRGRMVVAA
jgi:hypothetical protein